MARWGGKLTVFKRSACVPGSQGRNQTGAMWGSAAGARAWMKLRQNRQAGCLLRCHWGPDAQRFCQCYRPSRNRQPNSRPVRLSLQVSSCLQLDLNNAGLGISTSSFFLFFLLRSCASPLRPRTSRPPRHCLSLARSLALPEHKLSKATLPTEKKPSLVVEARVNEIDFDRFPQGSVSFDQKSIEGFPITDDKHFQPAYRPRPDCSLFCGDLTRALPSDAFTGNRSSHAQIQTSPFCNKELRSPSSRATHAINRILGVSRPIPPFDGFPAI